MRAKATSLLSVPRGTVMAGGPVLSRPRLAE